MDIFKTRLRTALANRNITQAQLAAYAKIDKGSVSGYLSGRCLPSSNRLERIAKVLNVSSSWLLGMDDAPAPVNPNALRVPVLGYIAAGIPIDQIEMVLDYEEMPASASAGGAEYFGLQVKGDSMERKSAAGISSF